MSSGRVAVRNTAGHKCDIGVSDKITANQVVEFFNDNHTGVVLSGADLTAVGIIGTNPYATLYPDGSIIGGSDNGEFVKRANGELEQYSKILQGTANYRTAAAGGFRNSGGTLPNWTFPIVAIGTEYMWNIQGQYVLSLPLKATANTTGMVNIVFFRVTSYTNALTIFQCSMKGRWK